MTDIKAVDSIVAASCTVSYELTFLFLAQKVLTHKISIVLCVLCYDRGPIQVRVQGGGGGKGHSMVWYGNCLFDKIKSTLKHNSKYIISES